ncbi:MAG: hypothetical protein JXB49_04915 [Bacteroidales bacterium]|nr:hypothetical protein [Bacteroidales bacterium]
MKSYQTILFLLFYSSSCFSQSINYTPLDKSNPIQFGGSYIIYQNDTINLGHRAFFIDGQLSEKETKKYPWVFNSINKAAEYLTNGSEAKPMVLYIAPWVYWIDDPDDTTIRVPKEGTTPYGLEINCEWLRFYGLSDKAENVVLACNRGQTIGAVGNFTLFKLLGDGIRSENITFGNYCNVDLDFPLKPELGREKRAPAIVQAQLIHCNGDKILARNTRFISRLNLCPFVGGKRVLFDRCHFESTDDALCGTGVYLNCTLDFYSSKPFYRTWGTGAVFLNCDIHSYIHDFQFFTKSVCQMTVVDTRITAEYVTYLGWRDKPPMYMRCYQNNVTMNGRQVKISKDDPSLSIDMSGKEVLDAYCFKYNGDLYYNTYNLLRGNDDWDPMGIKDLVLAAEKYNERNYTMLPTLLQVSPANITIETGKNDTVLIAKINRFGNYEITGIPISWGIAPEYTSLVKLEVSNDGSICTVVPNNNSDAPVQVTITAFTESGLEAASIVNVAPSKLEAPKFLSTPKITLTKEGSLTVTYKLDMNYPDQSLVTWYRCTDVKGSNPIEVAVSRLDTPLLKYTLSDGDIGYYIMASVAPKHMRCDAGEAINYVMKKPVTKEDVKTDSRILSTNFKNIPTKNQSEVIHGFWTMRPFGPSENPENERDAWFYGEGRDGNANMLGLLQTGRSGTLLYTPVGETFRNMKLTMTVAPFKTAGQGFSIAPLYMDVLIKFDTKTMTGYALRFIRTTKYHNAVDCYFVKYENGDISEISEAVSTSCYRTPCYITIEVKDNKLTAHASTTAIHHKYDQAEILPEVNIETAIDPNTFGGFGIQYNGGATTMIREIQVEWK